MLSCLACKQTKRVRNYVLSHAQHPLSRVVALLLSLPDAQGSGEARRGVVLELLYIHHLNILCIAMGPCDCAYILYAVSVTAIPGRTASFLFPSPQFAPHVPDHDQTLTNRNLNSPSQTPLCPQQSSSCTAVVLAVHPK